MTKVKKSKLPFVSIIVLNYNGKEHLGECFNSLRLLDYPKNKYEILMGDNGSYDNSTDYVKKEFPFVKVIKFNKNYGFAEGNNKSTEHTNRSSQYFIFLNNDTKVDKKWLIELVRPSVENEEIVCSGSKTFHYTNQNVLDSAGNKITIIGGGFGIGRLKQDNKEYNKTKYSSVCGASLLIRKDIFEKLGGFDRDYFAYFEDVDLCWRLFLLGYKAIYVPNSIVYHKAGGSFGNKRNSSLKLYLGQKNRMCNLIKNLEPNNLLRGIILSFCYDLFRILRFIPSLQIDNILAILKGNYVFIREITNTLEKRKKIQKTRKIRDAQLYRLGIIAGFSESLKAELYLFRRGE